MKDTEQPPSDRKCYRIAPDLYRMDQLIQMKGQKTGYDATGRYWVVGCIKVLSGQVWFLRDEEKVKPQTKTFIMVMPPNSVVSAVLKDATTFNSAVFSKGSLPRFFPSEAVVYPALKPVMFRTQEDVEDILKSSTQRHPHPLLLSRCSKPHPKSHFLMNYFGEHFQESTSLPDLARICKLAPSVLSRTFRRDWDKPPIHFRNYLRLIDSFRHLAEETAVTDVAFEVGFNDLSRFMKQFKSHIGFSPHAIQKRSKNAK